MSLVRSGSRLRPNSKTMAMVPTTTGIPTMANSAKPKRPTPASSAACEMTTLTGLPVRTSRPPALPANANGMSRRDGGNERRSAMTTVIGSKAATLPLSPIRAVSPALSSINNSRSRVAPSPARCTSDCPTQVVTPVASRPSLTTKRAPIRMTAGSPKPANDCCIVSTPSPYSASAAPMATSSTGSRFQMNSTTTMPSVRSVIVESLTAARRSFERCGDGDHRHGDNEHGRAGAARRTAGSGRSGPWRWPAHRRRRRSSGTTAV